MKSSSRCSLVHLLPTSSSKNAPPPPPLSLCNDFGVKSIFCNSFAHIFSTSSSKNGPNMTVVNDFTWNRALATVSHTFCRPHLPGCKLQLELPQAGEAWRCLGRARKVAGEADAGMTLDTCSIVARWNRLRFGNMMWMPMMYPKPTRLDSNCKITRHGLSFAQACTWPPDCYDQWFAPIIFGFKSGFVGPSKGWRNLIAMIIKSQ